MGVQNSIDRLNAIKARIRTNLVAQGITVPEDAVLSEMAEQILSVAGEDGVSATHSWNGTTLTVTSASGTSSANLKGDKGDTGQAGSNGVSVTVSNVSESTADGGSNVITFSDGKKLTVKNGSKGSAGSNGVSATHSWNGTTLTVTSASGTSSANLKGDKGDTGAAGKTPVKGTDYFTAADKAEIASAAAAQIPKENWTFTLEDGSTVTKVVHVG